MNKRKKQLEEQMNQSGLQINIEDLYKQLAANKNEEQFIDNFTKYLEELTKGEK